MDNQTAGVVARRTGRRLRELVATAMFLAALAACSDRPGRTVYDLAEYVDVAESIVATDVLIPSGDSDGLGQGWDLTAPPGELAAGIWVEGRVASFAFNTLRETDVRLEWEARSIPLAEDVEQTMSVSIGDVDLGTVRLPNRWAEGEIDVPAGLVRRGLNRIELRFGEFQQPGSDASEQRRLAARFRYLRATAAPEVAPWFDRPRSLRVTGSGEEGPGIAMPFDSALRVFAEVPAEARLVGTARAMATVPAGGFRLRVRVLEPPERRATLLEAAGDSDDTVIPIDLELSPGLQQLEIEVAGLARGITTLSGLRIEAPGPHPAAALTRPTPEAAAPLGNRPDVVILVLDAARADAFSPWGGRSTPFAAELAADGTVFDAATSNAPWTGPSVASLLTGRYPDATGVQLWDGRIPESIPTLFELASAVGYRTLLWSQHTVYRGNRSFRRGVDEYVDAPRSGEGMTPTAAKLFAQERPTLALVHLLPPHTPYAPPEPYFGRYSDWWQGPPPPVTAAHLNHLGSEDAAPPDPEYVRYVRDRYDENAAWADALVGRLIDAVRAAGRVDDTLFVLLSDHGEAFYEHGRFLHTQQVYRESLRIPMIFRWPANSGDWVARVAEPVSLVDVLPTIVEALDLDDPGSRLQGTSLLGAARGQGLPPRSLLASSLRVERHFQTPLPLARLRIGAETLIRDDVTGRVELYELTADPGQQTDLAAVRPLRAAFLSQQLRLLRLRSERLLLAESPPGAPIDLDPEVVEELRALGYIQ